jgi:tyrosyl-tRNA synthetase
MANKLSPEDSIALIKANLAEVLNPELIDHVILKEKRPLKVYWGTATTGKLSPMLICFIFLWELSARGASRELP